MRRCESGDRTKKKNGNKEEKNNIMKPKINMEDDQRTQIEGTQYCNSAENHSDI
jgi:hypothetical protein